MANEEQLRILKKEGVEAWNQWRKDNPDVEIKLNGVDLSEAQLNGADLNNAKLIDADLTNAKLIDAILIHAELRSATLAYVDLSYADLSYADLRNTNLRQANLVDAELRQANLVDANLTNATFTNATLYRADLRQTTLYDANLIDADLRYAYLRDSHLNNSNLIDADLTNADLTNANLTNADLIHTDLSEASLIAVEALNTNFNSAILTGACIEDWHINSETNFKGVICDYVYLKEGQQQRRPASGNFAPGEFSKIFERFIETVDLIFKDGIDWRAFLSSFQDLQVEYGEQNVSIQAIEKKRNGVFIIRLSVLLEADKIAEIESHALELYQSKLQVLEAKYREQLQHNTSLENIVNTLANRPIIEAQSKSIAETAVEIQQLLNQLSQTYATNTVTERMVVATEAIKRIERNPTLIERILIVFRADGISALKELLNHPAASFVIAALEDWQENKEG